jgi:hypothetical protein
VHWQLKIRRGREEKRREEKKIMRVGTRGYVK